MHVQMPVSRSRRKPSPARPTAMLLLALTLAGAFVMLTGGSRRGSRPAQPAGHGTAGTLQAQTQAAAGAGADHSAGGAEPAAIAPVAVTVETVAARLFQTPIRVTGTLKSDEVVALSTKATGLVRYVGVEEGDRVRAGQLLVNIDDRDLQAQREKAQATVQAAEARLKQALTSRGIKNAAVRSDYHRAQETLTTAQTRLSQTRGLAGIAATEVLSGVESARSALQAAREHLKVLQDGSRRQEKATAEFAVARAQSQANKLKGNLERREQLLRDGAIAREDVENARRDYEGAVLEVDSARQQADLVSEGPRFAEVRVAEEEVRQAEAALRIAEANRARRQVTHEDVDTAEAQVRQAEAGLDSARAALAQRHWNDDEIHNAQAALAQARADVRYYDAMIAQTRIYSPVNAVVSQRKIHVGEAVSPTSNQLMTLVATDTLYFEATAPESVLPYLRVGGLAEVALDALPGKTLSGILREIIPVAESASRSVRLRLSLPRPDGCGAVVGGFARATIRGGSRQPVLTLPAAALVSDGGEKRVFVLEEGRARAHTVHAGAANGARIELLDGLRAGDRVIIAGAAALADGQAVTVRQTTHAETG
jgi:RND family efflux transporter MFP subunit